MSDLTTGYGLYFMQEILCIIQKLYNKYNNYLLSGKIIYHPEHEGYDNFVNN